MELEEGDLNQVDDRPRENRRQDRGRGRGSDEKQTVPIELVYMALLKIVLSRRLFQNVVQDKSRLRRLCNHSLTLLHI